MIQELVLLLVCALAAYYLLARKYRTSVPLPPSSPAYPLLGHFLSLPASNQHVAYKAISEQLKSDVISFNVLGQVIIVLNSADSAADLLIKRSLIYSDRPEIPFLSDERMLVMSPTFSDDNAKYQHVGNSSGWRKSTPFLRYGERWKHQRKLTQSALHYRESDELWTTMTNQVRKCLGRLLHDPNNFEQELQWLTETTLLSSVYGYTPTYPFDHMVGVIENAISRVGVVAAGNFNVNIALRLKYILAWLPGASAQQEASVWREATDKMVNEPFDWTRSQMAAGTAAPSILRQLLTELATEQSEISEFSEKEDILRWGIGTLYSAEIDTSVSAAKGFLLAMVLYPDVQSKAQNELDIVLGDKRLPELKDRESLPYMDRVLKELFRWFSITPLGVTHACSQDDIYRGFRIPKGAIVVSNIWAISHDSAVYPEPHVFNPDRFLDPSVPKAPAFGFGRRICPGAQFSEASLFMIASTVLTVFDVKPTPGCPTPEAKFTDIGITA
ncbi:hypothetical protein FRC09_015732, partial [Ceratobasidium sp. 395]